MRSGFRLIFPKTFAATLLVLLAGIARGVSAASIDTIAVSYRLDPRVADPTHGGNRWISPPTYLGANAQDTIEALAQGVDAKGRAARINPMWIASDPGMVSVSPSLGSNVKIVVKRPGESRLKVVAGPVSTELVIKASYLGKFIQVAITRVGADQPAPGPALAATNEPAASVKGPTEAEARAAALHLKQENERKRVALQREKERAQNSVKEFVRKAGMVTLPTGLQYKVLRTGRGKKPNDGEVVDCKIRVTNIDGTEVDGSHRDGQVVTLGVGGDRGLGEALRLMRVGSKWQILQHSRIASREVKGRRNRRSRTGVAYSLPLVYEIELLAIKTLAAAGAQTAAASPRQR